MAVARRAYRTGTDPTEARSVNADIGPCDFHFRDVVCGFFEIPTDRARRIVPAGIQPIERYHEQSILAVLAFDFHGGHVGPYREVVLAIVVAPVVDPSRPTPHSAMYPFLVGTSTPQAREHGSKHYHLVHHDRDLDVVLKRRPDGIAVVASDAQSILELTITKSGTAPSMPMQRLYQVLTTDGSGLYVSDVVMVGELMEHEEETGGIAIHPHDFTRVLDRTDVSLWAFREQWMSHGTETYHPPRPIGAAP